MSNEAPVDYLEQCRRRWIAAIHEAVGPTPPTTSTWIGPEAIAAAVQPFVRAVNHLHLASGGGYDIQAVGIGKTERGTIVFRPRDGLAVVARARALTLEYIPAAPADSFLMFDLEEMKPSGVYPDVESPFSEEVIELTPGNYAPREAWDRGVHGHDENGDDLPLPDTARQLYRLFQGRLMMVAKGSRWIKSAYTYAGEHNYLSNEQIRDQIERAVNQGSAKLDPVDRQHIIAIKQGDGK